MSLDLAATDCPVAEDPGDDDSRLSIENRRLELEMNPELIGRGRKTLDVMTFLNEIVARYPHAISFAPGRPRDELLDVPGALGAIAEFVEDSAKQRGTSSAHAYAQLGQYGPTNGIIRELIATHLERDEGIRVTADSIIVTTGCQEAMAILLIGLFERSRDVLLVSDPTYIGITDLAALLDIELEPVAMGAAGLEPAAVADGIARVRARGKTPRALYHIPDFNNPLGTSMPIADRQRLLALADSEDLLLFEDNPYGAFAYDFEPLPTLKALDESARVIYLGSFSKTIAPGLRVGYLVADREVAPGVNLAAALERVKGLTTVNTSAIAQAAVGGVLLREGGSLRRLVRDRVAFFKRNRDHMLEILSAFRKARPELAGRVSWNKPGGGLFLSLSLPFAFGVEEVYACAADYGVICCPMQLFSLRPGREREVRLSFSYAAPEEVEEGVNRFLTYVSDRCSA